jgi:hypothetical protein
MATYLSGVTDYVPQIQPFQPDLNLYANVLQTKQTQYDSAWKSINKVYSQYFYADLTREDNLKRKEELMKNIDFNLKRVSGLDLSLSQNVAQATQVFKPFYEDNGIMKDMAWTKNFNSQVSKAQGFKNSDNEEQRKRYWDTGVQALNYMKDEFKEASASDALGIGNAEYTDYVNVQEKALKIAKDADLNVESVSFSPDGRWIIKKTNGDQLIKPLNELFEAQLGNDAAIQAVYKTQAYVDRKDYAYSNAAQFKGDKNAAEMKYLETNFNILKEQNQRRFEALQQESEGYSAKIADIKKQIDNGTASPTAKQALRQYEEAKQINDTILERTEKENSSLNGGASSTATTSTGFQNPYGDVKSLRWKVDNARASMLMQKDLGEAAQVLAYRKAKTDMDANPYAVNEQQHAFRMQESAYRMNRMESIAKMKMRAERQDMLDKVKLEAGTHYQDPETGQLMPYEAFTQTVIKKTDKGTSTDRFSIKEMSYAISKMQTEGIAKPFLQSNMDLLRALKKDGNIKSHEIKNILGMDLATFEKRLNANPEGFLRALGGDKLSAINSRMNGWITQNKDLSGLSTEAYAQYRKQSVEFSDYTGYLKADQDWRKNSAKEVERDLTRKGYKNAKFFYDENGNVRSEANYLKTLKEHGIITSSEYNVLMTPKKGLSKTAITAGALAGPLAALLGPVALTAGAATAATAATTKSIYNKVFGKDVDSYDDLQKAAWKSYASEKIATKSPLPSLEKFGQDMGAGKFTLGVTASAVNPKGITPSRAWLYEAVNDIRNGFDFGDPSKNIVTFGGTDATSIKLAKEQGRGRNDVGNVILSGMMREMENRKTKMGNFEFGVLPIAGGSVKKSAIIFYPDMKWLKDNYVYKQDSKTGKQTGPGYISYKQWERIGKNGIAFIMDSDKMSNSFYKNAFSSPLQSIVDYNGGYTMTDPKNPSNKWSVTPDKLGRGYFTTTQYNMYDENGKVQNVSYTDPTPISGASLTQIRNDVRDNFFTQVEELNKANYNRY